MVAAVRLTKSGVSCPKTNRARMPTF